MGRDRKVEQKAEHFTKLTRPLMETPAWRALGPTAQALYPWVKLEWRGPQANNNGKIRLSCRQAAERMGAGSLNTVGRAFHDLQRKGFIVVREIACLGVGGEAKAPAYEITELPLPGSPAGQRLYREWREGRNFPVQAAAAHNPTGRSRKTEPCRTNCDDPIAEIATFRKKASQK